MVAMSIKIRPETPNDIERIHEVTTAAFSSVAHSSNTEQYIVKALREGGALAVSLVAEGAGDVVGHVAVSPVTISDGSSNWYGLGPISVDPALQQKGIGSLLMRAALARLKVLNAAGCVLLGDPNYYVRFGFKSISGLTYAGVPPEYFQAVSFSGEFAQGEVAYHDGFGATA